MKKLVTLLNLVLLLSGANLAAVTLDSIIIEVWSFPAYTTDAWYRIPLADPNRGQIGTLSDSARIYYHVAGGTNDPNIIISDDGGESRSDSLNYNATLGWPGDHNHFTERNDSLFISESAYDDEGSILTVDCRGSPTAGVHGTPVLEAGASIHAVRAHPLPDSDSMLVIWRTRTSPRTYDVSYNISTDFGVTVGADGFVEDLTQASNWGGRLGACYYNNSVMAGIYDRDEYMGAVYFDRSTGSWGEPDTIWDKSGAGEETARWYDIQSFQDTMIFAGCPVWADAACTMAVGIKRLGDAAWTYNELAVTSYDPAANPASIMFSEIQGSGRMVSFYGRQYASGNYGLEMRWWSPEDSLAVSTSSYTIVGDSVVMGSTSRRFSCAPYVYPAHGDVSYVLYSEPATSTNRVIRVTFVPVEEGTEDYKPQSIVGGTVAGGTVQ